MLEQLTYEYCDLVMKGGVTSGVVYPLTIVELAKRYRFKNIGGTSAGAIAAVLTAAAEYGRRSGKSDSYNNIAGLPPSLGSNNLLLRLFEPSSSTAPIFRILLAAIKPAGKLGKTVATSLAVLRSFWVPATLGALLGAIPPILLFVVIRGPLLPYVLLGLLWVLVVSVLVLVFSAITKALNCTVSNDFGLCPGFQENAAGEGPPLTNWLHEQIQLAAGRKPEDAPLTFGDLWHAKAYPGELLRTDQAINLQVVTTSLTQGRPFTIPFESGSFHFDENEFNRLFPRGVVKWMVEHAPKDEAHPIQSSAGNSLSRFPVAEDLPVLVAARMSLSFPILLSAIPLYAVDYSLKRNQGVPLGQPLAAERCWFSDGGICSNFPIQFFDSPLPRWPTFGINLKAPHPDHAQNESDFVWLPETPGQGSQVSMNRFDSGSSADQLFGFFGAIVNTMQNWRDNIQATEAGYRDRIVHISLRSNEGGLNLAMPPAILKLLSDRGLRAGQLLREVRFFLSHLGTVPSYHVRIAKVFGSLRGFVDRSLSPGQ